MRLNLLLLSLLVACAGNTSSQHAFPLNPPHCVNSIYVLAVMTSLNSGVEVRRFRVVDPM